MCSANGKVKFFTQRGRLKWYEFEANGQEEEETENYERWTNTQTTSICVQQFVPKIGRGMHNCESNTEQQQQNSKTLLSKTLIPSSMLHIFFCLFLISFFPSKQNKNYNRRKKKNNTKQRNNKCFCCDGIFIKSHPFDERTNYTWRFLIYADYYLKPQRWRAKCQSDFESRSRVLHVPCENKCEFRWQKNRERTKKRNAQSK